MLGQPGPDRDDVHPAVAEPHAASRRAPAIPSFWYDGERDRAVGVAGHRVRPGSTASPPRRPPWAGRAGAGGGRGHHQAAAATATPPPPAASSARRVAEVPARRGRAWRWSAIDAVLADRDRGTAGPSNFVMCVTSAVGVDRCVLARPSRAGAGLPCAGGRGRAAAASAPCPARDRAPAAAYLGPQPGDVHQLDQAGAVSFRQLGQTPASMSRPGALRRRCGSSSSSNLVRIEARAARPARCRPAPVLAVGLAVRGVDPPGDAEHPGPPAALPRIEGPEGGDRRDEGVCGQVGHHLRFGRAPGEIGRHRVHVCPGRAARTRWSRQCRRPIRWFGPPGELPLFSRSRP